MISRFRRNLPLLLVALHLMTLWVSVAHYHTHWACDDCDSSASCVSSQGHAHGVHFHGNHIHVGSHSHDAHDASCPESVPANGSLPYHDHENCGICHLLGQVAPLVQLGDLPVLVEAADYVWPHSPAQVAHVPIASYHSRAPPAHV